MVMIYEKNSYIIMHKNYQTIFILIMILFF